MHVMWWILIYLMIIIIIFFFILIVSVYWGISVYTQLYCWYVDFFFLFLCRLYWSKPYDSDSFSLDPDGKIRMFSLLFAIAVPSDRCIEYFACTLTLFHVPLMLVKVVPSQLPSLSSVPPLV